MRLKDWNGGSVSELYRFDGHGNIVGDGRFWINTAYGSGYSSLPAKVKAAMGGVDTTKIRGYRFLGWYTGPQDNAGLYDWTRPLTGNVTVYAHWQRLQANVIYDKNASDATGSHANTTGWQYSDVTIPGDTSK